MSTSGAAVLGVSNGMNRVSVVKQIGVVQGKKGPNGRELTAEQQQYLISAKEIEAQPKGSLVSVFIENKNATSAQKFRLFDVCGIALAAGADDNGADIEITSSFAGLNSVDGYNCLKEMTRGTRVGSVGTMFEFSNTSVINRANVRVWNGNYEDYNKKTLANYFQMAKDTYANDQKILVLQSTLYLNGFLAITGELPAQQSLEILFNLTLFRNF